VFFAVVAVSLGQAWVLALAARLVINAVLLVLIGKLTDHLKIDGSGGRWPAPP
jgi:putative membrane protein